MSDQMRVIAMGVHVLDILVRPVDTIPEGQGATLVDEIKITAAGSAGGTAITLAKLGAAVWSAGAIGVDAVGDMLIMLLTRGGVDTSMLVRRLDTQTSATVLPIRPTGERPSFHVIGGNATFGPSDVDWGVLAAATHLHLGGPELIGGAAAATILSFAHEHGAVTSADVLAPGDLLATVRDDLRPVWPHLDYFLPNDEQVMGLTGARGIGEGARVLLERGVGCVAVTRGGDGVLLAGGDDSETVPAFKADVVDTTGCGDAFSAGFLRGLALGRSRRDAAVLGCATAALVAGGLGSDHGDFDLAAVMAFAADTDVIPA